MTCLECGFEVHSITFVDKINLEIGRWTQEERKLEEIIDKGTILTKMSNAPKLRDIRNHLDHLKKLREHQLQVVPSLLFL